MRAKRLLILGLAGWMAASLAASAQGAQQEGTSVIRGRVFDSDTKRPLNRARVTVSAQGVAGGGKATSTDADGSYEIKELPEGRYAVAVTRTGYLRLTYGQRLPSERGKPLPVADNQVVSNIDFLLPRMSLISGRIVDETGEPIPRVRVFAMRTAYFEGRRRLVPVATDTNTTTDHTGHYRIVGLMPGSYFVMSDVRETWTVVENGIEQTLGYAPTYFPGTPSVGNARRITVGVSEEASNNDFPLISGRAANVSGTATDSEGRPLAGRRVSVMQEFRGPGFGTLMNTGAGATVKADGSFRIPHLPPGEYTLQTSAATKEGASTQDTAAVPIRARWDRSRQRDPGDVEWMVGERPGRRRRWDVTHRIHGGVQDRGAFHHGPVSPGVVRDDRSRQRSRPRQRDIHGVRHLWSGATARDGA